MNIFSRTVKPEDLLKSSLYNEETFYKAFSRDFKRAQHSVIIESPFLTVRRAIEIAPLCRKLAKRGVKVRILTRNPNHHDGNMRIQAYRSIKILKGARVSVVACDDLRHRKLAVIDKHILWEGSLNMLSHSNSKEMMRRTESRRLSIQMLKFTGLNKHLRW